MICVQEGPKLPDNKHCLQDGGTFKIEFQNTNEAVFKITDEVLLFRQTTDGFGNFFFDADGTEQYSLNEDNCDAPNYSVIGNSTNLDRFRRDGKHKCYTWNITALHPFRWIFLLPPML